MSRLLKWPIKNRKTTILFAIVTIFFGIVSYIYLPKHEFPTISSPIAVITTVYPGANAEEVEDVISKPIEERVNFLEGINEITSISRDSVSVVMIYLKPGADSEKEWDKLKLKRNEIESILPDGAEIVNIKSDFVSTSSIILSLSSDVLSNEEIGVHAYNIKNEVQKLEGIKKIEIDGILIEEIEVKIRTDVLNTLPLTLDDIYSLLLAQTVEIPLGSVSEDSESVILKLPANMNSIEELENFIIAPNVFLKDIADINLVNSNDVIYRYNGSDAVLISVFFSEDVNVLPIGKDIETIYEDYLVSNPDLNIERTLYLPNDISNSLNNFMLNLLMSIVLIVIVVLIGMSFRNTLLVSLAIPLTIASVFLVMPLFNINIEQISIAALIISLGILVDNSIVISDAIQVELDKGKDKFESAYIGAKKSSIPVLTSTLTTVASFLPLAFLPGEAGQFAKSLPIIVSLSIISSYIVAMFVSPTLASLTFKPRKNKDKNKKNYIRSLFRILLKSSLKLKGVSIILAIVLLLCSVYFVRDHPIKIFPTAEKPMLYIDVKSNIDSSLQETNQIVLEVEKVLKTYEGIQSYTTSVGGDLPKFYPTVHTVGNQPNYAQILINVNNDIKDNTKYVYDLQKKLDSEITRGVITVKELELTNPGPPIQVRLVSSDSEKLHNTARMIENKLKEIPGAVQVKTDIPTYQKQYSIVVDEVKALQYGITKIEIQKQISELIIGKELKTFVKDNEKLNIVIKGDLTSLSGVEQLYIYSEVANQKIPLSTLVTLDEYDVLSSINRVNYERAITVSSEIEYGYGIKNVQNKIEEYISGLDLKDVDVYYGGDEQVFNTYIKDIGIIAIYALIIIYLILFLQFKSFLQPIIILFTIPLSFIGSLLGILIFNQPITFTVGLGMAALMGVVVNNGILLIEKINRERKKGLDPYNACLVAVDCRFRPIMISSITTIIGLIPLVINGGSFFRPLAIALMGGLTISTVLTLIIIPTCYYIFSKK